MKNTVAVERVPQIENIQLAHLRLKDIVHHTPLLRNINLSEEFGAHVYLKREDLQNVRSYKIRGAYNKISTLTENERKQGVICASAGNHAQGVAYSCCKLGIRGIIYMPATTPNQKVKQVKMFGKNFIEVVLSGDTYDDSYAEAIKFGKENSMVFVHPFDDMQVIEGQATVGLEILEDIHEKIDFLFVPVGGGGLAAGLGTYFKHLSPETQIIGVEPEGAPSMKTSLDAGKNITLEKIDKFVDGAAVKRVGELTFGICQDVLDAMITVPEGKICTTILKMYNEEAIVVEPAGALSITALETYREQIKGKNVVCVVSGSNNDITRMEEIRERSQLCEGLKHYFIIRFPQRSGALREFLVDVLGAGDDITHFEYKKKSSREKGPALVGVELQKKEDFQGLIKRLKEKKFIYEYLNDQPDLFQYLI
jgi:threonine dehydratase